MERSRGVVWVAVVAMIGVTVAAGPMVGAVDLPRDSPTFDGGNATVASVEIVDGPALEAGRFGTDVAYLRGPTARATVRSVTGTPRLVVRVEVPALDVDEAATTLLEEGERGDRHVAVPDRIVPGDRPSGPVVARTTVRVQSFDVDRTVLDRNTTVGGDR